jgi:hypothetical protein
VQSSDNFLPKKMFNSQYPLFWYMAPLAGLLVPDVARQRDDTTLRYNYALTIDPAPIIQ